MPTSKSCGPTGVGAACRCTIIVARDNQDCTCDQNVQSDDGVSSWLKKEDVNFVCNYHLLMPRAQ